MWITPSLALVGDALLYAILPGQAHTFGVSTWGVGVLLASNRVVRLLGMPTITRAVARFGMRRMMLAAVATAAISSLGYASVSGLLALWPLRLGWGLAYGTSFLCMLSIATQDSARVGSRVGLAGGLSKLPALLALAATPWALQSVGGRTLFAIAAGLALLALPLAMRMPSLPVSTKRRVFGWPEPRDRLFCAVALAVDGVLVTLAGPLLSGGENVVVTASVVLASLRAADLFLTPVAGYLCDLWEPQRILFVASLGVALGLFLIAMDMGLIAIAILVLCRPAITPAMYADARQGASEFCLITVGRLATWRDVGAAVGPVFALAALAHVGASLLFAGLGALLCVAILQWAQEPR